MIMGGIEKEIISILKNFDYEKYEVTLLLAYETDKSMTEKIPHLVNVRFLNIPKDEYILTTKQFVKRLLKKRRIFTFLKVAFGKLLFGIPYTEIIKIDKLPNIRETFDYAVCYSMHSNLMLRYVAEKINAKKKIVWVHNELSSTGFKAVKYRRSITRYDRIIAVSEKIGEEMKSQMPQSADKLQVIHNYLDREEILKLSEETIGKEFDGKERGFKIVTVGRICQAKGYDLAAYACKKIIDDGFDVIWFMIGDGEDERARSLVNNLGITDKFILLGRKDNPYPYIAAADLYVQPSRREAWCLTVSEAKILKKVVVCTNFYGSEQVSSGLDGIIVNSLDFNELAGAIERVLGNKTFYEYLKANAEAFNTNEDYKLQQIFSVFDDGR